MLANAKSLGFLPWIRVCELPKRETCDDFQVLLATANTPYFDDQQKKVLVDGLRALRDLFSGWSLKDGRAVEIQFRLSEDLAVELGLPVNEEDRPDLAAVMANLDAVITTPSTLYLESCRFGRPTALLDFFNVPAYVPSAWSITSLEQARPIIQALADRSQPHMQFQQFNLQQQLQVAEPAKARMLRLVHEMARHGIKCCERNQTGKTSRQNSLTA